MTTIYVLDVPENSSFPAVAAQDVTVTVGRVGPYFEIVAEGELTVDRRATSCRHAVWYSVIAGVSGGRIVQHDKDAFRAVPA
jgi:hypothetical protein